MDYRQSGVDIDAGNETVRRIKSLARATFTPGVLSHQIVGGLFRLDSQQFRERAGVERGRCRHELQVAFLTGRHDRRRGFGQSLRQRHPRARAEPLFFLDYLATGRLSPEVADRVVGESKRACRGSVP